MITMNMAYWMKAATLPLAGFLGGGLLLAPALPKSWMGGSTRGGSLKWGYLNTMGFNTQVI